MTNNTHPQNITHVRYAESSTIQLIWCMCTVYSVLRIWLPITLAFNEITHENNLFCYFDRSIILS